MLEYIFFDEGLRDKFVEFVSAKGVECHCSDDKDLIVAVSEDLDDEVSDTIEDYYDLLLKENENLLEETEDALEAHAAGVQVRLQDGSSLMIRVDPEVLGRLLNELSLEELSDFMQEVAEQVEKRDDRPLCHT